VHLEEVKPGKQTVWRPSNRARATILDP